MREKKNTNKQNDHFVAEIFSIKILNFYESWLR